MAKLELDLQKIAMLGERRSNENYSFRSFLKYSDAKKVDRIVHRIDAELKAQIDCTKCANCCKMLRPGVSNAEIEQIAPLFACTPSQFNDQFVDCSDGETEKYFKNLPCMCLKDTRCTIYEKRPECCKDFPNTHKHQFTTRLFAMIEYYSICPIVFNLMEMLKLELGYRVDRR